MTNEPQRYVKDDIDTRSLAEICQSLPEAVRIDLRNDIIKNIGVSRGTVHYWMTGHCKPNMGSRRLVAQSVKKITGIHAHAYTLFP